MEHETTMIEVPMDFGCHAVLNMLATKLLFVIGAAIAGGEARRLINKRVMSVDGETVKTEMVQIRRGSLIKVGNHKWYKITGSKEVPASNLSVNQIYEQEYQFRHKKDITTRVSDISHSLFELKKFLKLGKVIEENQAEVYPSKTIYLWIEDVITMFNAYNYRGRENIYGRALSQQSYTYAEALKESADRVSLPAKIQEEYNDWDMLSPQMQVKLVEEVAEMDNGAFQLSPKQRLKIAIIMHSAKVEKDLRKGGVSDRRLLQEPIDYIYDK